MSYIHELRASKDKPQVAFQEFALLTRRHGRDCFYAFLEGDDNGYYVPRIRRFCNDVVPIHTGGKKSVKDVFDLIKKKLIYSKYSVGFFVDKDFEDDLPEEYGGIFETSCYSIENYYISEHVFNRIAINEFGISSTDPKFDQISKCYKSRLTNFLECMTLFNSWYACLIEKRGETGEQTGVRLSHKAPSDLYDFSLTSFTCKYDLDKLIELFPSANPIDLDRINAKIGHLENSDRRYTFRGKFLLDFLIKFIKMLLRDEKSSSPVVNYKFRYSGGDGSSLNQGQVISLFSGYAEEEEALLDYIQRMIK